MDTSLVACLVLGAMFFVCVHGNGSIVISRWRAGSLTNAVSAPGKVSLTARSGLECLVKGKRAEPRCEDVTFDKATGLCLLCPQSDQSSSAKRLTVWNPVCLKSDAPTTSDSYVTVWSRDQATLSLTGNVACYADFVMAVGADATLRCRDVNGVALWAGYRNGDCRRVVFSGEHYSVYCADFGCPLPATIHAGWSVCITGIPTVLAEFAVTLVHKNHLDIYIASIRLKHLELVNTILFTNYVNGEWTQEAIIEPNPYPFSVSVQFMIKIEATDDTRLDYYVNDQFLYTSYPPGFNLQDAETIKLDGSVQVIEIKVGC